MRDPHHSCLPKRPIQNVRSCCCISLFGICRKCLKNYTCYPRARRHTSIASTLMHLFTKVLALHYTTWVFLQTVNSSYLVRQHKQQITQKHHCLAHKHRVCKHALFKWKQNMRIAGKRQIVAFLFDALLPPRTQKLLQLAGASGNTKGHQRTRPSSTPCGHHKQSLGFIANHSPECHLGDLCPGNHQQNTSNTKRTVAAAHPSALLYCLAKKIC